MAKLKKLISKNESKVKVICPLSDEDILKRQTDYPLLGEVDFAKRYRGLLFKEVTLNVDGVEHEIQANFYTSPFCRWFGLPQHKYQEIKNKPSRYKLVGKIDSKSIKCNEVPTDDYDGIVLIIGYPHFQTGHEGIRYVDCITDLSRLSSMELAEMLYNVDMRAINTYFNQIRRRASILERPLVSGRGKSYIYSNFNPKYAHYMLTILRTYLNFCEAFKYKKEDVTPAMLLGIADKPFTMEDIIYFI